MPYKRRVDEQPFQPSRAQVSQLGKTIQQFMEQHEIKLIDLEKETGVSLSTLSRVINGRQKFIADDDFDAISNFLALKVPADKRLPMQARLVAARVEAERKGPGAHLVEISVNGKKVSAPNMFETPSNISDRGREALAFVLNELRENPEKERFFISWAEMMGME